MGPAWITEEPSSEFPDSVKPFTKFGLWIQTWIVMGETGKARKVEKNLLQRS